MAARNPSAPFSERGSWQRIPPDPSRGRCTRASSNPTSLLRTEFCRGAGEEEGGYCPTCHPPLRGLAPCSLFSGSPAQRALASPSPPTLGPGPLLWSQPTMLRIQNLPRSEYGFLDSQVRRGHWDHQRADKDLQDDRSWLTAKQGRIFLGFSGAAPGSGCLTGASEKGGDQPCRVHLGKPDLFGGEVILGPPKSCHFCCHFCLRLQTC